MNRIAGHVMSAVMGGHRKLFVKERVRDGAEGNINAAAVQTDAASDEVALAAV